MTSRQTLLEKGLMRAPTHNGQRSLPEHERINYALSFWISTGQTNDSGRMRPAKEMKPGEECPYCTLAGVHLPWCPLD